MSYLCSVGRDDGVVAGTRRVERLQIDEVIWHVDKEPCHVHGFGLNFDARSLSWRFYQLTK